MVAISVLSVVLASPPAITQLTPPEPVSGVAVGAEVSFVLGDGGTFHAGSGAVAWLVRAGWDFRDGLTPEVLYTSWSSTGVDGGSAQRSLLAGLRYRFSSWWIRPWVAVHAGWGHATDSGYSPLGGSVAIVDAFEIHGGAGVDLMFHPRVAFVWRFYGSRMLAEGDPKWWDVGGGLRVTL